MPIVDYEDVKTGEIIEVYIRTGEIPETVINDSSGNEAKRVYSGKVGFEFRGTGFYETDYKNK
jgi:predicted nucleic acid-binding Zn ribbon protein